MERTIFIVRRGVVRSGQNFEMLYKFDDYIKQILIDGKKQTTIDVFFHERIKLLLMKKLNWKYVTNFEEYVTTSTIFYL